MVFLGTLGILASCVSWPGTDKAFAQAEWGQLRSDSLLRASSTEQWEMPWLRVRFAASARTEVPAG